MIKRLAGLAALAASLAFSAAAQLPVVHGEPAAAPKARAFARLRLEAPQERLALPPVSEAEVASVRGANARTAFKHVRRLVVGLERESASAAALPSAAQMAWQPVDGGRAAQVALTSPGAASVRLAIDLAAVPDDVEMVFRGNGGDGRLEGPVRVGEIADRSQPWWSPLTEGDTQSVELFVPSRHDPLAVPLRFVGVSHLFTAPSDLAKTVADIGRAGSCNVDVACSGLLASVAFRNVAASVAQMVFNDGHFVGLCTGTLLNDADPGTQIPWFYGANHCFENESAPYKTPAQMQAVASTLSTLWKFEADRCGSGTPLSGWSQLGGGAQYIFNNAQKDVLFLRLNAQPPAGAFYSGWDPNGLSAGTPVITVHHPEGDLKKVTQGTMLRYASRSIAGGLESFAEVRWSSGTTEPGSSGSGLWSASGGDYLFRGALWGGDALCDNPTGTDNFSRFDQVYASLARYLADAPTDFTDLWYDPNEVGWGLNLVQHASRVMFGTWYTYEGDGTRTWFVVPSGTWTAANVYTGPLYATSGPAYSSGSFSAGSVRRTQVGSVTITFSDANNGQFAFSVNGVSGVKRIVRQPF